jgi:cytoskeleton protein RodZ
MTDPSATVGHRLKAERERRNLSSQKAADELHLDGWIIDALEAEDYERIGPSVYAKGHLKRYAALLGLPAAEIMQGYDSRAHVPKPPASQAANVKMRSDAPAISNLPWPQVVGSVAVALLVIGVLWWKPWHQRGSARVATPPAAANPGPAAADGTAHSAGASVATDAMSAASVPATVSTSTSSSPTSAPQSSAAAAPAAADANPMAGTGRARLRLSFSADSWVDVHDAAGRRAFAGNGRANSVRTIAGIAPMRVYLGFASGVQLEINNRAVAIGPQFVTGDVARFEAGADGVLRRDSHGAAAPGAAAAPGVQSRNARPSG